MKVMMGDGVTGRERVRVTWEGAFLVDQEYQAETTRVSSLDGEFVEMPVSHTQKFTVMNPERVWVESLDPEKIRERISGEWVNPDAVALQVALDKANAEIERQRAQMATLRENYDATKELWRKRYTGSHLASQSLDYIAEAIEEMKHPSPPDPMDW